MEAIGSMIHATAKMIGSVDERTRISDALNKLPIGTQLNVGQVLKIVWASNGATSEGEAA